MFKPNADRVTKLLATDSPEMKMKRLVRFGAYPLTMALVIAGVWWTRQQNYPLAWLAVLAASGMAAVALFELSLIHI